VLWRKRRKQAWSGTLFASHKLPLRTYLGAIAIFCNEVKGNSMLAMSRDLGVSYVKPANRFENRVDRRVAENRTGKRKVVVVIRERGGDSLPAVFRSEQAATNFIRSQIRAGTIVNADEASSWDCLQAEYEMKRINHGEAYSLDGACTNWAEEHFSRLRRGEIGHHHHISGPYLLRHAQEAAWREDSRHVANGEQLQRVAQLAMARKPSVDFSGYWQRHKAA
jgi:hypothetical protein